MERILTYNDIHNFTLDIIDKIDKENYKPHLVAGFCRGGMLPAITLSHYYNCSFVPVEFSLRDLRAGTSQLSMANFNRIDGALTEGKNILIIDDICDSGKTYQEFMNLIDGFHSLEKVKKHCRTAALQIRYTSTYNPDYTSDYINNDDWQIYPWEIKNGKNE